MYRIAYASTANQEFSGADLKRLLIRARLRNKAAGVTGMLVFHEGSFLQALEGDEQAVTEIFDRIKNDPRHRDVEILNRGMGSGERGFGDWAMGFADYTGVVDILKGFVRFNTPMKLAELDGAGAMELLAACGRDRKRA
jgi:hypothetical protein